MDILLLGTELKKIRKQKNMTQKELCENICTQGTISMIEKGEIVPGLEILNLLCIRLNESLSNIIKRTEENFIDKVSIVNKIEKLTIEQDYTIAYEIVIKELNGQYKDIWYNTFLKWNKYICEFYLSEDKEYKLVIQKIKSLINCNSSLELSKYNLLNRIYNSLAVFYSLNKQYKESLFYYSKISIENHIDFNVRLENHIYYLRTLYNKVKTLYDMKNYEEALKIIDQGLTLSIELENMSFLGHFYYYKGLIYEVNDETFEKISNLYSKAYFYFSETKRNFLLKEMLKNKSKFININNLPII